MSVKDEESVSKGSKSSKEWGLIEKTMARITHEQTLSRRWGIFFKLLTFGYLFALLWFAGAQAPEFKKAHTAMVQVNGMIGEGLDTDANILVSGLRKAFAAEQATGVLLSINSPGGTPVQSAMVYKEIMRLRELHPDKKVVAAITDTGASGAYYIAAAAEEIYSNEASIVGSIGVISAGFGFTGVIDKLGVERRVFAAGDNKAMLDPFVAVSAEQAAHFEKVLDTVHQQFVADVKAGRSDRLVDDPSIFSGLFWTGAQAKGLGLVDGFASPGTVAREVFKAEKIIDYTPRQNPLDGLVSRLGVSLANQLGRISTQWSLQ